MKSNRDLLLKIVKCSHVVTCFDENNKEHPCYQVVNFQKPGMEKHIKDSFQVPEPWNGRIDLAPILFISSNPSFSPNDYFPTQVWSDEEIIDFFNQRFQEPWTEKGKRPLISRNGCKNSYSKAVAFWSFMINRVVEIKELIDIKELDNKASDYASTEIVRCKSKKEIGVRKAKKTCYDKYFEETIQGSGAKLLYIFGKQAEGFLRGEFNITGPFGEIDFHGFKRVVIFSPHPSEVGSQKKISEMFSPIQRRELKQMLLNIDLKKSICDAAIELKQD